MFKMDEITFSEKEQFFSNNAKNLSFEFFQLEFFSNGKKSLYLEVLSSFSLDYIQYPLWEVCCFETLEFENILRI